MTILPVQRASSLLLSLTVLSSITACVGGGTMDIVGEDDATFVGSITMEKQLSDRTAIDISYLATGGSNSQFINTGIQYEGSRVTEGTIENTYMFQAVTAHYDYTYFLGERFRLSAAPAVQFSYFDLEGMTEGLPPRLNELYPAYGLRLGASYNFNDRTSIVFETALYDQKDRNGYSTSGIWLAHGINKDIGLKFGYSIHDVNDGDRYSSDSCRTPDAEPDVVNL